eukprot:TRINITY_DN1895_c0_g1_i1.p1 TRINITY_DN1895_c0_g1~~TRINITY_DN1895_c0_g1_i1.p1  ORF type:complete len:494 (-),score=99.35 TRINITY_DN1895_c0_g1_i1:58-1431(-)
MSAIVNSEDDNGILCGNWSGKYQGGTPPTSWTGSTDILNQFYISQRPVKYGQCWVFGGVLTSVMRSLGIPARTITNFDSAHDTSKPYNRKVDKFYSKNYQLNAQKTTDSIWNFHVWNDVWMKRPDLKPGYGGWQALDATPQEESEGIYQTGPCPLAAIKNGDKSVQYDLEFLYAEVNADVHHYLEEEEGKYVLIKKETDAVGHNITTKAIGKFEPEDITLQYKYEEGTVEERAAMGGEDDTAGDTAVSIVVPTGTPTGSPIVITINLAKEGDEPGTRTAQIHFSVAINYYTGKPISALFDQDICLTVPDDKSIVSHTFTIPADLYIPFLGTDHNFIARAFVYVPEVDQTSLCTSEFDLEDPPINFTVPPNLTVGKIANIQFSFKNPLPVELTNVYLSIEGQGLIKRETHKLANIPAGGTFQDDYDLACKEKGSKYLIVAINANELYGSRAEVLLNIE